MAKVLDIHLNDKQRICLCGGQQHKDFSFTMAGREKQKKLKIREGTSDQ